MRVRVASERDGQADGLLGVARLEEGQERLGHRALAGDVNDMRRAEGVQGTREIVPKAAGELAPDVFLGGAAPGEEHGERGGLGALDALGRALLPRDKLFVIITGTLALGVSATIKPQSQTLLLTGILGLP